MWVGFVDTEGRLTIEALPLFEIWGFESPFADLRELTMTPAQETEDEIMARRQN